MYWKPLVLILTLLCAGCSHWQPAALGPQPGDADLQRWPVTASSWWSEGRLKLRAGPYQVESVESHWATTETSWPATEFRLFDDRWLDIVFGLEKRTPAYLQEASTRDKFSLQIRAPDGLWQVECHFVANVALARWYPDDPLAVASLLTETNCDLRDAAGELNQLHLDHEGSGLSYGELRRPAEGYLITASHELALPDAPSALMPIIEPQLPVEYRITCGERPCARIGLIDSNRVIAIPASAATTSPHLLAVASLTLSAADIQWRSYLEEGVWLMHGH